MTWSRERKVTAKSVYAHDGQVAQKELDAVDKGLAFEVCAYREISHVNVHSGVLVELPLRAQQCEPGSDGTARSGSN